MGGTKVGMVNQQTVRVLDKQCDAVAVCIQPVAHASNSLSRNFRTGRQLSRMQRAETESSKRAPAACAVEAVSLISKEMPANPGSSVGLLARVTGGDSHQHVSHVWKDVTVVGKPCM